MGSRTLASRKYGIETGAALQARLADLWAARNVEELPLWSLVVGVPNRFTVPVLGGVTLLLESNHAADRVTGVTGTIDWKKVVRVQLLEVKQYA